MDQSVAAVTITNLSKTFRGGSGPIRAVDGISLTVGRGEILALLGANGAGKTTTLDLVLGFTEASEGSVQVFGNTPRQAISEARVAAVLQTGGLLRDLTVAETAQLIASTYDRPIPVEEALQRAGLETLGVRLVGKCSGGEQQRLRFALALLADPDLLILDEPTAGMDVSARHDFWDAMQAEADRGTTIIFATHYLEEAERFARRTVLMAHGKIIADGPTEVVRSQAVGRTVSATVPEQHDAILAKIDADPSVTEVVRRGDRVAVTSSESDRIARIFLDMGGSNLEIVGASLDDAIRSLTARSTTARSTTARSLTAAEQEVR